MGFYLSQAMEMAQNAQCPLEFVYTLPLGVIEFDPRVPVVRVHPRSDEGGDVVPLGVFSPYPEPES